MDMKISFALIIFYLASLILSAAIAEQTVMYKKVDKNGKVIFTDKPIPGSTPITINTNRNIVTTPKAQSISRSTDDDKKENEQSISYDVFSIEKPSHDEGVRANDGNLYVIVAISPQLQPNHSIRLHIDGSQIGQDQKVPYFSLINIDRGTHQLLATIIDDTTQQVIQSSQAVEFHLLRASRLTRPGR